MHAAELPAVTRAVERDAEQAVARARADHDIEALLDLAAGAPMLESGRRAALDAARLLFERGRWWPAASLAGRARGLPGASELRAAAEQEVRDKQDSREHLREVLILNRALELDRQRFHREKVQRDQRHEAARAEAAQRLALTELAAQQQLPAC